MLTVVVAPLLAEVAASRQIIERQAVQLVSQAEAIGELEAAPATLLASTAAAVPDPTPAPFWARWPRGWAAYAATLLAIVAGGAAVAVVRS